MKPEYVLPADIERRSFEIIESELDREIPPEIKPVVMRVIHTTADFDYLDSLYFSPDVMETAMRAIRGQAVFVTDTNMAGAGINRAALARHGCTCECFMADPDIAAAAKANGTTRAQASVDKAAALGRPVIFACGNAPTALIRLTELIEQGSFRPELVIAVPVGFVNVVQSKEMLIGTGIPCIAARGRKGGSNVAAAICNALLYLADKKL